MRVQTRHLGGPAKCGETIRNIRLADGVGFEPTAPLPGAPVFKTGALNRSATHPNSILQVLRASD